MYLKEIQTENFKSMKGTVKIGFRPGFTGVTGPNGSGKSNITDAILFVLGPKSSKAIRAGNLLELMWNGGENGRPADRCRVTLVFDNKDRTIPVGYDEVHLTRVIKRAPENKMGYTSYFYVNGNKSTLREFEELLMYAGISSEGYNMIQQGDVTRIVKMGGVERRRIIESIAGITQLDEEMEKARKKREGLESNLEKIAIIMDELKARLKSLEADRGAALSYRKFEEEMNLAQAQLAYKRIKGMNAERESLKKSIADFETERKELEKKIEDSKKRIESLKEAIDKADKEMASRWGSDAVKIKEQIDAYRLDIARAENTIEKAKDDMVEIKRKLGDEKKRLSADEKEHSNKVGRKHSMEKEMHAISGELLKASKELEDLKDRFARSSSRGKDLRKENAEISQRLKEDMKNLSELKEKKGKIEERMNLLKERKAKLEEEKKKTDFNIKDAKWQIKNIGGEGKLSIKQMKKLKEELFMLRVEERETSEQMNRIQQQISSLTERYATANARLGGSRDASSAVLSARDRGELKGIIDTVENLVSYEGKYSTAMEIAAGRRMKAVVVENDEAAASAIKYLKSNRLGRTTFLPLNRMTIRRPGGRAILASKKDGALGFAVDIANYDERYTAAVWYTFGDTVIVKDLNTARKMMGGVRLVTLGGELIEASGAMVGGSISRQTGSKRAKDVEELGHSLREKRKEAERLQARLAEIRPRIEELDEMLKDSDDERERLAKIENYRMKLKEYEEKRSSIESEIASVMEEIKTAEKESRKISESVSALEKTSEEMEKRLKEIEEALSKLMPENIQQKMNELESLVSELRGKKEDMALKLRGMEGETASLEKSIAERKERMSEMEKELDKNSAIIAEKRKEIFRLNDELKAVSGVSDSIEKEMEELRRKKESLIEEKSRLSMEIESARERLAAKQDFVLDMSTKMQVMDSKIAEAEEEYRKYGIEVSEPLPSIDSLKKTIRRCELAMADIGTVNFKAIGDYEEESARYESLEKETAKINEQKKELLKVEEEIEQKKKDGFFRVFSAVNENFKRVYSEVSEGGEGGLVLDNPESPFEGGLNIFARPKGKKVLRIEALSGGEKGLVALSFIFAIQEYDPSTFYIFDEADQNLDGLNSELVAKRIRRSSERAQFIVVSLRKATLKYAENLIGVTSMGDGITRIVQKVDIDSITEPDYPEDDVAEASA